jgi:adenosylmethionine-8-amino-7-oxononanoate aminotransferase
MRGARSGTVCTVFGEPEADGAGTGVAVPASQYLRRR